MVDLGEIDFPEQTAVTLSGVTLELWSRMGAGKADADLQVDYLLIVPTDDAAHVTVKSDEVNSFRTLGDDMTTPPKKLTADSTWVAGAALGNLLQLNANLEGGGVGGNTNGSFTGATGKRHRIQFNLQAYGGTFTFKVRVVDITADSEAVSQTVTVTASYPNSTYVLYLDDTNAHAYQAQVVITAFTSGSLYVDSIRISEVPYITQNQMLRTDPGSDPSRYAAEQLDSSGKLLADAQAQRVPFWIPPGLSILVLDVKDNNISGHVEPKHIYNRLLTVTPTVYPRWWT